ncbi:hypothetical protein C4577_07355 [Candidatus Parcubacteria bacterium]|nr:MAG: hypothetical protein C4577_07355 [Candidatus Parcubacteria bacterium]
MQSIKQKNDQFKGMTKKEKAVAVAKDVLKHLRSLKFTGCASYCEGDGLNISKDENVQPHISKLVKNCEVCALGGMFLSYIRLFDNVKYEKIIEPKYYEENEYQIHVDRDYIIDKFKGIFDRDVLDCIEDAYEGGWDEFYPDPRDRIKAIMKNIVKNNGRFIDDLDNVEEDEVW